MSKKKPEQEDDMSLFQQEMTGVKRLKQERVTPKTKPRPPFVPEEQQTQTHAQNPTRFIEMDYTPTLAMTDTIEYHQSGLRDKLLKQFKGGKLPIEACLDLHGRRVTQAGERLQQFIDESFAKGLRTIMVIHGKGYGSVNETATLKQHINVWLRDYEKVLAFTSAQERHGGSGALYVYLKRNPDAASPPLDTE